MRFRKERHAHGIALNMAPMIDIVFLLIIFFMTVQEFSRLELEAVDLTRADEAQVEIQPPPERMVINVRADGGLVVGGTEVSLARVTELLARERQRLLAAGRETDLNVIVRADGGVRYERIQALMQEAAALDIWRVTFAAAPEEEGAP